MTTPAPTSTVMSRLKPSLTNAPAKVDRGAEPQSVHWIAAVMAVPRRRLRS